MRIVLVCPYDLAVPGGVQSQTRGLAAELAAGGDQVLVVAPGIAAPVAKAGYDVAGVGASRSVPANGSAAPVALSPTAARSALSAISQFRPEVVHIQEPFAPIVSLAALATAPPPLLGTFHRAGASGGYRAVGRALRPLAKRLDLAVAVSKAARATVEAVVGDFLGEVEVLANGIDVARFAGARPATRRPGPSRLVFFGRVEPRKGLADLLAALTLVAVNLELTVVGDGPQREHLERATAGDERIRFLGRVGDAELDEVLGDADVAVLPARGGESFGVVLLEAMAAGAAVICSDLPGYREAAGEAVAYVPPGDRLALADAITRLLGDEAARAALAGASAERAAEFGFAALAAAYRERYAALVELRGARRGS